MLRSTSSFGVLARLGGALAFASAAVLLAGPALASPARGGGPADHPPVVDVPGNIVAEATGAFSTLVPYDATATDDVDLVSFSCDHPDTKPFFVTTTAVTCTARDSAGQVTTKTFDVTVEDTTPPTLTVPGNVTVPADGPHGTVVSYPTPEATDAVAGTYAAYCDHVPGVRFPIGVTTVSCLAYDGSGNHTDRSFSIHVTLDPAMLSLPPSSTVEATGPDGATVDYPAPTAVDEFGRRAPVTCDHPSGATYALGSTTVTCTASTDGEGEASGSFAVDVVDTTAPVVTVPRHLVVAATSPAGAVVTYVASARDVVAGRLPVTCTIPSGSLFVVGDTTVTCHADDGAAAPDLAAHLEGSSSFTVTVTAYATGTGTGTGTAAPGTGTAAPTVSIVAAPAAAVPVAADLPFTGSDTDGLAELAYFLVGGGVLLVVGSRRHRARRASLRR